MPSLTKRRSQKENRADEESFKNLSPAEQAEAVRRTMYKQLRDADFLNNQWRHSLTRVSIGLALILIFKIYRTYQDLSPSTHKSLLTLLTTDLRIESTGVVLALLITDFIRKSRPSLPITFYLALVISVLELWMWIEVARQPGYRFTIDSNLPVGAFYFLFTWGSHAMMERTVLSAQDGVRRGEQLVDKVNSSRSNGSKTH